MSFASNSMAQTDDMFKAASPADAAQAVWQPLADRMRPRSLDEIAVARNNDVVLVPEGYHPVAAGHGYNVYYLNFLTGSDQSLANTDDPDHKWIYDSWKGLDPRKKRSPRRRRKSPPWV